MLRKLLVKLGCCQSSEGHTQILKQLHEIVKNNKTMFDKQADLHDASKSNEATLRVCLIIWADWHRYLAKWMM